MVVLLMLKDIINYYLNFVKWREAAIIYLRFCILCPSYYEIMFKPGHGSKGFCYWKD